MTSLAPGTVVGDDFVVERELSHGGMGAVYICLQRSTGKRRALKVMLAELVQHASFRDRFELEARIGSRIESSHVVEVVGAGVSPFPWMAMELLEGEDLLTLVQRNGPLTLEMTTTILEQACHALGAAHAAGIVHRDLKPDNIFLARSRQVGAPNMVKILDFGISKITNDGSSRARANTGFMGTRPWMAPEQATVGAAIGPQADVWALGLIAFFLLTGRYYWRSMYDPHANDVMLMMEVCATGVLEPPRTRAGDLGFLDPLPQGFDAWFARCVTRDVSARYRDAGEAFAAFRTQVGAPQATLSATLPMLEPRMQDSGPSAPAADAAPAQPTAIMTVAPPIATIVRADFDSAGTKSPHQGLDLRTIGMMFGGMVVVVALGFVVGRLRAGPAKTEADAQPIAELTPTPTADPPEPTTKPLPPPPDVAGPPDDAIRTKSGLAYKILSAAAPTATTRPTAEAQVKVHYTGWTTDGKMFDSSVSRGMPATFPLKGVIPGWTEGLQLMRIGEKTRFWIPEELAYKGKPGRPQGTLVFDVELLEIKNAIPAPADVAKAPADAKLEPSGLASKVLTPGKGTTHPTDKSEVEVHYTGWTTDGKMFDSSIQRGEPMRFQLDMVIKGWTEGVQLMVEGEKRRFWIPEALAYKGGGGPQGTLVFEVELIRIVTPSDVAPATGSVPGF